MTRPFHRWAVLGLLAAIGCSTSEPIAQPEDPDVCSGFNACLIQVNEEQPSQIRYSLRLQDANEQAIKDGVTSDNFRILENEQPLDLTETSQFLTEGDNLPLKIVLVLDYTQSMAEAGAIQAMIDAAELFIYPTAFVQEDELVGLMTYHAPSATLLPADNRLRQGDGCDGCAGFQKVKQDGGGDAATPEFSVFLDPKPLNCEQGLHCEHVKTIAELLPGEEPPPREAGHAGDDIIAAFDCMGRIVSDELGVASPIPAVGQAIDILNDDTTGAANAYKAIVLIGSGCRSPECNGSVGAVIEQATRRTPATHIYAVAPEGAAFPGMLADLAAGTQGGFYQIGETEDGTRLDWPGAFQQITLALQSQHRPLKVMVVVDSSAQFIRSGERRAAMAAAREFILPTLYNATHRIGLVEFHDLTPVGQGYDMVQALTPTDCVGRRQLINSIPQVGERESGQTRLWDALTVAMNMLSAEGTPGERRLLVFLTDGNDTSSVRTADDIITRAAASDPRISLYPIGFGAISEGNRDVLQKLADDTNGIYATAASAADLEPAFRAIAEDLRGQWELTYITQKVTGNVEVTVQFSFQDQITVFHQQFNAAQLRGGDIHTGIIHVEAPRYDPRTNRTRFNLRAQYMPRNIDRFRFRLPNLTSFELLQSGGLISKEAGWRQFDEPPYVSLRWVPEMPDQRRAPQAEPVEAIPFGAFGTIGVISALGEVSSVAIEHDDTIYDDLVQSKKMSIVLQGERTFRLLLEQSEGGSATVTPDGGEHARGTEVTLRATPEPGYVFVHWDINGDRGGPPEFAFPLNQDLQVTPVFELAFGPATDAPGTAGSEPPTERPPAQAAPRRGAVRPSGSR